MATHHWMLVGGILESSIILYRDLSSVTQFVFINKKVFIFPTNSSTASLTLGFLFDFGIYQNIEFTLCKNISTTTLYTFIR